MVILSHIAFVCFAFLFNNVIEKVWTKKKGTPPGKKIFAKFLHNANLPINLSAKESDWEGFVKRPETLHIRGVKQRLIIRFQHVQIIVES